MRSFTASALTVAAAAGSSLLLAWPAQAMPFSGLFSKRATVCNGDASLCSRLYSNVTFIGAHDSYAISDTSPAANQDQSITKQLDDGIRMLQAQAHKGGNGTSGIELCHTDCFLYDGGSLENWLGQVKSWSDAHPNEVVSLLIVNSDNLPASQFAKAYEAAGIAAKSYKAPGTNNGIARNAWPTLGSLIDAGTPIVSFLASGADTNSVPYLLDEFSNMWENPYDQTKVPFDCKVDRIGQGKNAADIMYLINHFKDLAIGSILIPDKTAIDTTNSKASILQDANNCASLPQGASRYPNFILLDFYDAPVGQPFQAAAQMNGVQYKGVVAESTSNTIKSSTAPTAETGASTSSAARFIAGSQTMVSAVALTAVIGFVLYVV